MSDSAWATVGKALLGLVGTGGLVQIARGFFFRQSVKVDVAEKVNDLTLEWAKEVKAEADAAKKEANAARIETRAAMAEADALRRKIAEMDGEVASLSSSVRRLKQLIFMPDITIDQLRQLVGADPGPGNGALPDRAH